MASPPFGADAGTPSPPVDPARWTFVVNPRSAGGRTGRSWPARERQMRGLFPQAEVQFTHGPGDATRIARQAVARGQQGVVVVGGDGSVNEVVDGLLGQGREPVTDVALGILPSGTGCDLVRTLGLPSEFDDALGVLRSGRLRRLDAGLAWATTEQGELAPRCFLNVASLGITATVARKVNGGRKWFGTKPTFLWSTVSTLLQWSNPEVELSLDRGAPEQRKVKAVVIANARYFGGGMGIAPDAEPDDGLLDVVVFGDLGRLEAVRRLGETYAARVIEHDDIDYRTASRIDVVNAARREIHVEVDGELWGSLPAHFEVLPDALPVVVPMP